MNRTTRRICLYALGTALFTVLSLCLQVPVYQNYYLCLGYVVMAVWCYSFGTLAGTLTGTLGVVLYCLLTSGLRGMPGWALGNVVIGVGLGLTFRFTKRMSSKPLAALLNIAAIGVSTALGILIVKSAVDSVIRAQPMAVRIASNMTAFVADIVVLLVSLPVCVLLDRQARKLFPDLTTPGIPEKTA